MRILIATVVAIASLASQQPDVTRRGPAVGAPAPGFELSDQVGR
jgi:hypothetical protein